MPQVAVRRDLCLRVDRHFKTQVCEYADLWHDVVSVRIARHKARTAGTRIVPPATL